MPTVSVNGAQLYYEVHGQGKPLVLSHTGMSDVSSFSANIPVLSRRYRVIAYDRRDCGRSKSPPGSSSAATWVEDVRGLLQALGIQRAYVGGVSYGALITLEFVMAHQEMVEGAILVSGTTQGFPAGDRYRVAFPDRSNDLGRIDVPVLIVHGANDTAFPPSMAEFSRDHIRGAEAAILYGSGHSLHAENPGIFNTIVLGWLEKGALG